MEKTRAKTFEKNLLCILALKDTLAGIWIKHGIIYRMMYRTKYRIMYQLHRQLSMIFEMGIMQDKMTKVSNCRGFLPWGKKSAHMTADEDLVLGPK